MLLIGVVYYACMHITLVGCLVHCATLVFCNLPSHHFLFTYNVASIATTKYMCCMAHSGQTILGVKEVSVHGDILEGFHARD